MRRLPTTPFARVVLAVAGLLAALAWLVDRVEVEGSSMAPTYEAGDRLLLVRRLRAPRPGDVVALDDPREGGRRLVKRVVAVRGDEVDVVGDNVEHSTDSRAFGPVPRRTVRHLVVRRYASGRS